MWELRDASARPDPRNRVVDSPIPRTTPPVETCRPARRGRLVRYPNAPAGRSTTPHREPKAPPVRGAGLVTAESPHPTSWQPRWGGVWPTSPEQRSLQPSCERGGGLGKHAVRRRNAPGRDEARPDAKRESPGAVRRGSEDAPAIVQARQTTRRTTRVRPPRAAQQRPARPRALAAPRHSSTLLGRRRRGTAAPVQSWALRPRGDAPRAQRGRPRWQRRGQRLWRPASPRGDAPRGRPRSHPARTPRGVHRGEARSRARWRVPPTPATATGGRLRPRPMRQRMRRPRWARRGAHVSAQRWPRHARAGDAACS